MTGHDSERTGFPDGVVAILRDRTARTRAEIVASIRAELPQFESLMHGGSLFQRAVDRALADFLARVSNGARTPVRHQFYREIGRAQAESGGTMTPVSEAFRIGMKAGWRELTRLGGGTNGVRPDRVWRLGEVALLLFAEISEQVQAGFLGVDAGTGEDREARRAELLTRLLSDRDSDHTAVGDLARRAAWPMPDTVCVVVIEPGDLPLPTPALPRDDILVDTEGPVPRLLVPRPDSDDWLAQLGARLDGHRLLIGPTVPVHDAARSFGQALEIRDLVRSGLVKPRPVVRCDENLRALFIMRNRVLVEQLASRVLAPLNDLDRKRRARSGRTLLAWLKSRGNIAEVAERLGIHHQTARYRMREMHRRYGDLLDDPGFRFDLEIVLRALDALFHGADGSVDMPPLVEVLHQHGIHDVTVPDPPPEPARKLSRE